jgi:hypothetical protein
MNQNCTSDPVTGGGAYGVLGSSAQIRQKPIRSVEYSLAEYSSRASTIA